MLKQTLYNDSMIDIFSFLSTVSWCSFTSAPLLFYSSCVYFYLTISDIFILKNKIWEKDSLNSISFVSHPFSPQNLILNIAVILEMPFCICVHGQIEYFKIKIKIILIQIFEINLNHLKEVDFRGLVPHLLHVTPNVCIIFAVYESVMSL